MNNGLLDKQKQAIFGLPKANYTISQDLSHEMPLIKSYANDLLSIYNAIVDILPGTEGVHKPPKLMVDDEKASVIDAMRVIKIMVDNFSILYRRFVNLYLDLNDQKSFKNTEDYVLEINRGSEVLFRKFEGFLGSAFAMQTHENSLDFVSQQEWLAASLADVKRVAENTFQLVKKMGYIFYGEAEMPILITYRDEGRGAGAAFDHYNIQRITGRPTVASIATGFDISVFENYLAANPYSQCPNMISYMHQSDYDPMDVGMIVIPGFARSSLPLKQRPQPLHDNESENKYRLRAHKRRIKHEQEVMHDAKRERAPLLAICGGVQTMTEAFNGCVAHLPPAKKRVHNKPMMQLLPSGKFNNVSPAHSIHVWPGSQLDKYLHKYKPKNPHQSQIHCEITSVHWFSVSKVPPGFVVSAYASRPNKAGGYTTDTSVVEAIENYNPADPSEAPMIGIQGHPDAMTTDHPQHHHAENYYSLFNSLAEEGDERHKLRILKQKVREQRPEEESDRVLQI